MAFTTSLYAQERTGISHLTYGSTHALTVHDRAIDHVQLLYHYAQTQDEIPSPVIETHTKASRSNLHAAIKINQELANIKPDDEMTKQLVASISSHHRAVM